MLGTVLSVWTRASMTNTMQLKFLTGRVSVPSLKWIGTEKARELSNGELVMHNVVLDAEPDAGAGACPENERERGRYLATQPRWMAVLSCSACVMYWCKQSTVMYWDRPPTDLVRGGEHTCVLRWLRQSTFGPTYKRDVWALTSVRGALAPTCLRGAMREKSPSSRPAGQDRLEGEWDGKSEPRSVDALK